MIEVTTLNTLEQSGPMPSALRRQLLLLVFYIHPLKHMGAGGQGEWRSLIPEPPTCCWATCSSTLTPGMKSDISANEPPAIRPAITWGMVVVLLEYLAYLHTGLVIILPHMLEDGVETLQGGGGEAAQSKLGEGG